MATRCKFDLFPCPSEEVKEQLYGTSRFGVGGQMLESYYNSEEPLSPVGYRGPHISQRVRQYLEPKAHVANASF
jgi:hypothetical protein